MRDNERGARSIPVIHSSLDLRLGAPPSENVVFLSFSRDDASPDANDFPDRAGILRHDEWIIIGPYYSRASSWMPDRRLREIALFSTLLVVRKKKIKLNKSQ